MNQLIIASTLLFSVVTFGQELNKLPPSTSNTLVIKFTEAELLNKPTLQELAETLYTNSVAVFENGNSIYKTGEFPIYVNFLKSNGFKTIKSKEVNNLDVNKIKSFMYQKSDVESALFGANGEITGMIYIEIDQ